MKTDINMLNEYIREHIAKLNTLRVLGPTFAGEIAETKDKISNSVARLKELKKEEL